MKNVYLFIASKEFLLEQRQSEVYILTRVDLPVNHVLRFLRDHPSLESSRALIPDFEPFPVQAAGFAWRADLNRISTRMEYRERVWSLPNTRCRQAS